MKRLEFIATTAELVYKKLEGIDLAGEEGRKSILQAAGDYYEMLGEATPEDAANHISEEIRGAIKRGGEMADIVMADTGKATAYLERVLNRLEKLDDYHASLRIADQYGNAEGVLRALSNMIMLAYASGNTEDETYEAAAKGLRGARTKLQLITHEDNGKIH